MTRRILALLFLLVVSVNSAWATTHYVSPTASNGTGTISNPWSIFQIIKINGDNSAYPAAIQPGDTILLRQGNYRLAFDALPELAHYKVFLTGTAANRITVRSHPGELATIQIEYLLEFLGAYTTYRDLEITNTWHVKVFPYASHPGVAFMRQAGLDTNVINCYIHDTSSTEQTFKEDGQSGVFYGNIVQYSGVIGLLENRTMGNTGYAHSFPGPLLVKHNILINQLSNNLQHFGSGETGSLTNVTVEENLIGQAGTQATIPGSPDRAEGVNVYMATPNAAPPVSNYKFLRNYVYSTTPGSTSIYMFGRQNGGNTGLEFTGNVIVGGNPPFSLGDFVNVTGSGNTIVDRAGTATIINDIGIGQSNLSTSTFNFNIYHSSSSVPFRIYPVGSGSQEFLTLAQWRTRSGWDANSTLSASMPTAVRYNVYANEYEQGRANIYIYNPGLLNTVDVSLAGSGLINGQTYKIQDAQNFLGPAVFTGTYSLSSPTITLNLAAMTARAVMFGENDPAQDDYLIPNRTTKELAALVVLPTSAGPGAQPPTVSLVTPANLSTVAGTVNITATAAATAPATIASVQYYWNNVLLGAGGAGPTYSFSWNTTLSNNGTGTLKAIATDSVGASRESVSFTLTIDNAPAPDTTPPVVAFTNLVNGDFITDQVTLKVDSSDNVGVTSVQFRHRPGGTGSFVNIGAADTTAPYQVVWDSTGRPSGNFEISALASDAASNTTAATIPSVTLTTPVGYTAVVNDLLTGNGGANLSAHTADSGHTWAKHSNAIYTAGNFLLDSNAAHAGNTADRVQYLSSYTPPTNDYRTKITHKTIQADDSQGGFFVQGDPTADVSLFLNHDGDAEELAFWHRNAGPNTKLASYNVGQTFGVAGSSREIILDQVAGAVSIYLEGIRRIFVVAGSNPLATSTFRRVGLRGPGTAQTATTGYHIDSFSVSTVVSSVPAPPTNISCDRASNTTVFCAYLDNADNETGFVIEQSVNGTDWVSAGADLAANSSNFTVTTALAARQFYRVRAKTASEQSTNVTSPLVITYVRYCWSFSCP